MVDGRVDGRVAGWSASADAISQGLYAAEAARPLPGILRGITWTARFTALGKPVTITRPPVDRLIDANREQCPG
ncbi:MAG: hypothetical protein R2731_03825 [Nocardioides sp.]